MQAEIWKQIKSQKHLNIQVDLINKPGIDRGRSELHRIRPDDSKARMRINLIKT